MIGDVAGELELHRRPAQEASPVQRQSVTLDQLDVGWLTCRSELLRQAAIPLDGDDALDASGQRASETSLPRADLQYHILALRLQRIDDPLEDRRVTEEVLAVRAAH